ncbi:hypothetical protein ACYQ83_003893 [Salmonella enterica subsp. enterica serovar Newport]
MRHLLLPCNISAGGFE